MSKLHDKQKISWQFSSLSGFLWNWKPVAIKVNNSALRLTHFILQFLCIYWGVATAEFNPLQRRRADGGVDGKLIYLHWDDNIEPVLGQVALWNHAVVAGYCKNKRNA